MKQNGDETELWQNRDGQEQRQQNRLLRYQLVDRLLQSVAEGNEYQALEAIRGWNALGPAGRLEDNLTECKYELLVLMGLMVQKLRELGTMEDYLDDVYTEFIARIDQAKTMGECSRQSENMVRRYCGMRQLRTLHDYSALIQNIILAVDKDLTQPLTLQYFADRLSVNSSYLSNLFRKETGETLTEYVTIRRISHAANLLRSTPLPIKNVAKHVGISDVQYFSKLFKRKMGMTPTQYRETGKFHPPVRAAEYLSQNKSTPDPNLSGQV
jgi:AraC-like DNA-binding protein